MKKFFTLLFTLTFFVSYSQVKVDAKATGKHARIINQAKSGKQTAKERREQAEQIKEQVKARKYYRTQYDSLKSLTLDTISWRPKDYSSDSLNIDLFTKEDSLALSEKILSGTNFPPEYRDLILNPIEIPQTLSTEKADSIALAEAVGVLESEAKKFMPNELGEGSDPLTEFQNPAGDVSSFKPLTKPNPNLIKPDKAKELFNKIDPEQFKDAQAQIQGLKKKYSQIPDTRYPEEGTKRNSLEDKPFKNRLYFGGNIGLQSTDPLILNNNLQLGYWINKKWLAGVGIVVREQFSSADSTSTLTGDGYGYSLFSRYDVPKGFFGWLEVERQVNKSLFSNESANIAKWESAYLAGIGREFKIGFVQMMSMILYDFNYRNNDLNARPIVFKMGVRFSKKP